ncbi:MAG: ISAs1 family transposase [Azonexus sp.]
MTDEEQRLLEGVQVRLLRPGEREQFDQLLLTQHYLKSAALVGEQVRYVAQYQGQWVALLAWCAGAYHLKARETWIGWTAPQKKRRLALVVNSSRFLVLEGWHVPNLASRVMKLCLQRLSQDWTDVYGHAVLAVESFVDPQQFLGTCYKASGWTLLGHTQGSRRVRQDFYLPHDRPKQLWVRELRPGARTILRGRNLPEALRAVATGHPPECSQRPEELARMAEFFRSLSDWRKRQPDFRLNSLVAVSLCAMLSGVCLGQRDLAAFAADLTVDQMEALRFPRDWTSRHRRYRPPGESSFFRMLTHVSPRQLEAALLAWQDHVLGRRDPTDDLVAVDGKELLNSQGLEIVSAYSVRDGRWLGSEPVAEGSNEIPAAQALLQRTDLQGALVTADAMHTQTETARIIVQERGADYLFTVKGNQKDVSDTVRQLYQNLSHAFSPSGQDPHRPDL